LKSVLRLRVRFPYRPRQQRRSKGWAMAINAATPQDTESIAFGSGASTFPWWKDWEKVGWDYDEKVQAPDDWVWRVTVADPNDEGGTIVKDIRHADIMRAARKIFEKDFDASRSLKVASRDLTFKVDACDFDAGSAVALLQVAVLGDIVLG